MQVGSRGHKNITSSGGDLEQDSLSESSAREGLAPFYGRFLAFSSC